LPLRAFSAPATYRFTFLPGVRTTFSVLLRVMDAVDDGRRLAALEEEVARMQAAQRVASR
jgi:hypothetical protein